MGGRDGEHRLARLFMLIVCFIMGKRWGFDDARCRYRYLLTIS